jgi:hypothetical protein
MINESTDLDPSSLLREQDSPKPIAAGMTCEIDAGQAEEEDLAEARRASGDFEEAVSDARRLVSRR